jgi:hypothetical protein
MGLWGSITKAASGLAKAATGGLLDLTKEKSTKDTTYNNAGTNTGTTANTNTETRNPYVDTTGQIMDLGGTSKGLSNVLTSGYLANLPGQEQAQNLSLQNTMGDITANNEVEAAQRGLAKNFYSTAQAGVDPNAKANKVEADVINQYNKAGDIWKRNAGRYGINPYKMDNTERINDINQANSIVGARTLASDNAEQTNFNRKLAAMGTYGATTGTNNYSGGVTSDDIIKAIQSAGSSFGQLLNPQSTTSSSTGTTTGATTGTGNINTTDTKYKSILDSIAALMKTGGAAASAIPGLPSPGMG